MTAPTPPTVTSLTADDGSDPTDADLASITAAARAADAAAEAADAKAAVRARKAASAPVANAADGRTLTASGIAVEPASTSTMPVDSGMPSVPQATPEAFPAQAERNVLIHFLEDGFTAFGQVWYRGQEIEIPIPGPHYEATKDINGTSWLDSLLGPGGEMKQARRWGKIMFREGPWPGDSFNDETAALREEQRRRQPPPLPLAGALRG